MHSFRKDLDKLPRDCFDNEDVPSEWIAGPDLYAGHIQVDIGPNAVIDELMFVPGVNGMPFDEQEVRRITARAAEFALHLREDPLSFSDDGVELLIFRPESPVYAGSIGTKGYSLSSWAAEEASRGVIVATYGP